MAEISRSSLVNILKFVKNIATGINTKTQIPVIGFSNNHLLASNNTAMMKVKLDFDDPSIKGVVNFTALETIVKNLETDTIEIRTTEKSLMVESGKSKSRLKLLDSNVDEILSHIIVDNEEQDWFILENKHLEALSFCNSIIDQTHGDAFLRCIWITPTKMCCSDQVKVAEFMINWPCEQTILLPIGISLEIENLLAANEKCCIKCSEKAIQLRSGSYYLEARLKKPNFAIITYDLTTFFDSYPEPKKIKIPEGLASCLKIANSLTKTKKNPEEKWVTVKDDTNEVAVLFADKDLGSTQDKTESTGYEFEFNCRPQHLLLGVELFSYFDCISFPSYIHFIGDNKQMFIRKTGK